MAVSTSAELWDALATGKTRLVIEHLREEKNHDKFRKIIEWAMYHRRIGVVRFCVWRYKSGDHWILTEDLFWYAYVKDIVEIYSLQQPPSDVENLMEILIINNSPRILGWMLKYYEFKFSWVLLAMKHWRTEVLKVLIRDRLLTFTKGMIRGIFIFALREKSLPLLEAINEVNIRIPKKRITPRNVLKNSSLMFFFQPHSSFELVENPFISIACLFEE